MRSKFEGVLVVYRDGHHVEHLSAKVTVSGGTEFYYYRAPKSFMDLIEDGMKNAVRVSFTANQDGSNPRSVVKLSDPY